MCRCFSPAELACHSKKSRIAWPSDMVPRQYRMGSRFLEEHSLLPSRVLVMTMVVLERVDVDSGQISRRPPISF